MTNNIQILGTQVTSTSEQDSNRVFLLPFIALFTGGSFYAEVSPEHQEAVESDTRIYATDGVLPSHSSRDFIISDSEGQEGDILELLSSFYSELSNKQKELPIEAQEIIESNLWDLYIKG